MLGTKNRTGGPRMSGEEFADPGAPARDAVVARLFSKVFASVDEHLVGAGGPLAAEVWASGLCSVWAAPPALGWGAGPGVVKGGRGGSGGKGSAGPRAGGTDRQVEESSGFLGALVRYAGAQRTPGAAALLAALSGVATGALGRAAAAAAADLRCAGAPTPGWAELAGRAQPTEAWVGTDAYGDQDILIIGFGYEGRGALPMEERHTICVLVDHNHDGAAKDAYPAADLPVTLARWRDTETNGIRLHQMSLSEAAGRLADATRHRPLPDDRGDSARAIRLADLWALLGARLATLPAPERAVPVVLDRAAQLALVAEFLESPEAAALLCEPQVTDVCERLVAYRCDGTTAGTSDADPLRWSPTLVGRYLLDVVPFASAGLDVMDLALVPDVLLAWVGYAGRRRGVSAAALARTVAAVEACRVDFTLLIGAAALT